MFQFELMDCHVCEGIDSVFINRVFVLYTTGIFEKRLGFSRNIIKVFAKIR